MGEKQSAGRSMGSADIDTLMIGGLVSILGRELSRRVTRELAERGFADYRQTYQAVFQYLRPKGSRLTELAERALLTKQSMGETVDALERLGYVERVPDPSDGRATLIRRTARGREVNRIAAEVVSEAQREWAAIVGEERFVQALSVLREIAHTLLSRREQ